jgi:hypothetical protein
MKCCLKPRHGAMQRQTCSSEWVGWSCFCKAPGHQEVGLCVPFHWRGWTWTGPSRASLTCFVMRRSVVESQFESWKVQQWCWFHNWRLHTLCLAYYMFKSLERLIYPAAPMETKWQTIRTVGVNQIRPAVPCSSLSTAASCLITQSMNP